MNRHHNFRRGSTRGETYSNGGVHLD